MRARLLETHEITLFGGEKEKIRLQQTIRDAMRSRKEIVAGEAGMLPIRTQSVEIGLKSESRGVAESQHHLRTS